MDKMEQQVAELLATGEVDEESLRIHLETAEKMQERFIEALILQRQSDLATYGCDILDGSKDPSLLLAVIQREMGHIAEMIISDEPNPVGRAQEASRGCVRAASVLLAMTQMLVPYSRSGEEGAVSVISLSTQPEMPFVGK